MSKISILKKSIKNPDLLKKIILMGFNDYLWKSGWSNSVILSSPVDVDSKPIPWLTYPCIDFLSERLNSKINVLEFGCGNSTLYLASLVNSIASIEHDNDWCNRIKSTIPSNASIYLCPLEYNSEYCRYGSKLDSNFDLILVDGRDRVNCVINSLAVLSDQGCIILDDSEREQYKEAMDFLISAGFKMLNFWGIAPAVSFKKCTTIFYRQNNCLEI